MGFYGGLADLLVSVAARNWEEIDDVSVAIALDSWHPTPGTRITAARFATPRLHIQAGKLVPLIDPRPSMEWSFQIPSGGRVLWRHLLPRPF